MSGIEDFSGFEVVRAAMEVEKRGRVFYSAMAARADDAELQSLFLRLAQDEVEHLHRLETLVAHYAGGAFWDDEETALPYLQRFHDGAIFPSQAQLNAVLEAPSPELAALALAIRAEEGFALFFQSAADRARSSEGREAFHWLAREEQSHAALLRERLELVDRRSR